MNMQTQHGDASHPCLTLRVNGQEVEVPGGTGATLLHILRNDLALNGPKYGCGLGQCGACTVLVDGVAARSCCIPAAVMTGRSITTLEGLAAEWRDRAALESRDVDGACSEENAQQLHPVQQAFIDEQAAQCGYCINGMIVTAAALLARDPDADEAAIRRELSSNLCRCGTHVEIIRAVMRAAVAVRSIGASEIIEHVPTSAPFILVRSEVA